ncbi:MAG: helix-turn-helix domain-containing protein [Deltaproteobacteria bacterium]|nr:helix-turn-helix domain-containing protein [Deltaproteobacteria bacterium]
MNTAVTDERWRSVDEVAEYLGVKRDTLYKLITRKNLPAHKLGRLWRFKFSEVDEWMRSDKLKRSRKGNEKRSP